MDHHNNNKHVSKGIDRQVNNINHYIYPAIDSQSHKQTVPRPSCCSLTRRCSHNTVVIRHSNTVTNHKLVEQDVYLLYNLLSASKVQLHNGWVYNTSRRTIHTTSSAPYPCNPPPCTLIHSFTHRTSSS